MKGIRLKITWLLCVLAARPVAFATTNLPIVNLTLYTSSITEGQSGSYFKFTASPLTTNIIVRVEIAGSASPSDFNWGLINDTADSNLTFPTNIHLGPPITQVYLQTDAILDSQLEPTEYLTARILPDPSYNVGPSAEATLQVLDKSPWTTNAPPTLFFPLDTTNYTANAPLSFTVTKFNGSYDTLLLRLLIDGNAVDEAFFNTTSIVTATLQWSEPTIGRHSVQIVGYTDRGNTNATPVRQIFVASSLVTPSRTFTMDIFGSVGRISSPQVSIFKRFPDESRGFVEFPVPASAATQQASIFFSGKTRGRLQLFAYRAGPTNADTILALPRELLGSIDSFVETNSIYREFDITPWTQRFAGEKIGVMLAVASTETAADTSTLSNFLLRFYPTGTIDGTPHIRWLSTPPTVIGTSNVTVRAEIFDADSSITRVYLTDSNNIVAVVRPDQPYPPGAHEVELTVTNLTAGQHRFTLRTASLDKTATSEDISFTVAAPSALPMHKWLGSYDSSASFYVVDAAGAARVWGRNDRGQLGLGFISDYVKTPVTLLPPPGRRILQIASGINFAVSLMDDGSLYFFGVGKPTPTLVPLPRNVTYFRALDANTSTLTAFDQAGHPYTVYSSTASTLPSSWIPIETQNGWRAVDSAVAPSLRALPQPSRDIAWGQSPYSYVIANDGVLYKWNATLSLPSLIKMEVTSVTTWRRIVTSSSITLAIDDQERIWSWAPNGAGGITTPTIVTFPKPVAHWLDIAATSPLRMALSDQGELFAWGTAVKGAWSDPNATTATTPELISGLGALSEPSAPAPIVELSTSFASPSSLTIDLDAPTALSLRLQTSTDLADWYTVTNIVAQPGTATLNIPFRTFGKAFYRIAP